MNSSDLTIRETDLNLLRELVLREDGIEAAAYVLCGQSRIESDPWERRRRHRFTVHTVLPIPAEDAVSASERHVTWSTASYVKLLKRATKKGSFPVSSIPPARTGPILRARRLQRKGSASARAQPQRQRCDPDQRPAHRRRQRPRSVVARSPRYRRHGPVSRRRQAPRHSRASYRDLQSRVSRTSGARLRPLPQRSAESDAHRYRGLWRNRKRDAMLLARIGVGQLALFDEDRVDVTNLNRLHEPAVPTPTPCARRSRSSPERLPNSASAPVSFPSPPGSPIPRAVTRSRRVTSSSAAPTIMMAACF